MDPDEQETAMLNDKDHEAAPKSTTEGTEESQPEPQEVAPEEIQPTDGVINEESKDGSEVDQSSTDTEKELTLTSRNHPAGLDTLTEVQEDERQSVSPVQFPENTEEPDSEKGKAIEVSESLSVDNATLREEESIDFNAPAATSTPPPEDEEVEETPNEKALLDGVTDAADVEPLDDADSPEPWIIDRAQLIEKYREALEERAQLQNLNSQLQHKLAEYFKKKKTDERSQELDKSVADQEQRYLKYMSNLEDLQDEKSGLTDTIKSQIEDVKVKCTEKQNKVQIASDEFSNFKYEVAKNAVSNRSGKPLPLKDLQQLRGLEAKKEGEVIQVRLENIKLKNKLKKRELQLKAKEELADGLHLIDFEQLKIENQTYNEKIEERNEELLKLRKKITTTVQVLTHVKEKLQFVQGENEHLRNEMYDVESSLAKRRDVLTRTKQVRDALRNDNLRLKQKCGLLGNEPLLRDFEIRKDEGEELQDKLERLKERHVELSINLNGMKKKVNKAARTKHQ